MTVVEELSIQTFQCANKATLNLGWNHNWLTEISHKIHGELYREAREGTEEPGRSSGWGQGQVNSGSSTHVLETWREDRSIVPLSLDSSGF